MQFDFAGVLGPPDGRWVVREPGSDETSHVIVVATNQAPSSRKPRKLSAAPPPAEVSITRVTVIETGSKPDESDAQTRVDEASGLVGRALTAHRVALVSAADPGTPPEPIATRVGIGTGPQVADGFWMEAQELATAQPKRSRRRPPASDERFAALLSGRQEFPACALIALRARSDVDAGRTREAALMIDSALGAARSELAGKLGGDREEQLAAHAGSAAAAAEAARTGEVAPELLDAALLGLERLEAALRSLALGA